MFHRRDAEAPTVEPSADKLIEGQAADVASPTILSGHPDAVRAAQAAESDQAPTTAPDLDAGDVRIIRWKGEPVRTVQRRLRNGTIVRTVDWDFEPQREAQYDGTSVRSVRPASFPGLSRTYHFGPRAPWLAELYAADAALILESDVGFKFQDVTGDAAYDGKPIRRLSDPLHAKTLRHLARLGRT